MTQVAYRICICAPQPFLGALETAFLSDHPVLKEISWCFSEQSYDETQADLVIRFEEESQQMVIMADSPVSLPMPVRIGVLLDHIQTWYKSVQASQEEIVIPPYIFSFKARTLVAQESQILLTEKEADLLKFMADSPNFFVTREQLLEHVWAYAEGVDTHTIETHIYRLRQKIEQDPTEPKILITEDKGYRLVIDKAADS